MRWIRSILGYPTGAARGTGSASLSTASAEVASEAKQLQQNLRHLREGHDYPLAELASRIAGAPVDIVRKESRE